MRYASLFPAIALLAASAAAAQEITLYENDNYYGRRFSATQSVQNLQYSGFNDMASSATVRGGRWQICTDAYYRGRCVTLEPGNYPSLASMGLSDRVSSVREIGWEGGGGSGGGSAGGSITFYDRPGLSGQPYSVNTTIANFDVTGFNDRAESAIVREGTWQLCLDANFQGLCQEFAPGQYQNLGPLSGRVSSARLIGGGAGGSGGSGGGWGSGRTRVLLYPQQNFGGRPFTISSDYVDNLAVNGFNDRASSIRVERGYWLFCSDASFRGECRTLGPGDYATLPYGINNRISSARRISEEYPYSAPPRWGN